jgi:uncharacterized repeat protein (TIGR02543 family)
LRYGQYVLVFRRYCTAVIAIGLLFGDLGGVASASQSNAKQPQVVSVCVNNSTSTLRKSIDNRCIFGAEYKLVWSTRGPPPKFCFNTSNREMTAAYVNTCPIKRTRLARPRSNNEMLGCADKDTGVMHWPLTGQCWWENSPVKWFAEPTAVAPPTATTSTTVAPPTATTSTTVAPPTATTSTTVAPSPATNTATTTTTTVAPSTTTTTLPDTTPPTVTLARSAATSSSAPISFTVTGNEDINCATLSLTTGTDFTLTNISTITSITQTSSDVCTIIAVSTATTNGDAVVSTLTRASTFSIDDTAGNSQTVLAGSPQSVTVTRNGEPNAPVISSATAGNAQVTVVWSTPASNGSTITDYLIKYSLSADGTYTTFADGVSTATSATVTGLTNGTAYYFEVAAKNSVGTGSYSAASADATPTMPTLTISYAAGSGSGTAPVSPVSVLSGSTFTTPANTYARTGYAFAGWSDGSTTYAAAAMYPSSGTVASNVALTAQWTANTLTVTTDEQGGNPIDDATTTTGASMSLPGTPTRTGYTFAGWFVATSGGSAITFPYAHGQTVNFTLYAQWTTATCATGGACAVGNVGPGGGIVFYVHASGTFDCGATLASTCKYLEAAPTTGTNNWTDAAYVWSGNTTAAIGANAQGTAIGTGYKNTEAMVTQSSTAGRAGTMTRAYGGPNNLSDWYLPSKDEQAQLRAEITRVGGFKTGGYWSSSESDASNAKYQDFPNGTQTQGGKRNMGYVRPVRAFG